MNRMRGTSAALVALVLLTCCRPAATPAAPPLSAEEAEQAAIYTAVVRQVYAKHAAFGGRLGPPVIYLVRRTDDSVGDPSVEQAPSATLPETVQTAVVATLADLPSRFEWVDSFRDVALEETTGAVAGHGAIITLGNIHHFQADGSALVSARIYVAGLSGMAQTYVLERVDGAWTVTGTTGFMAIS